MGEISRNSEERRESKGNAGRRDRATWKRSRGKPVTRWPLPLLPVSALRLETAEAQRVVGGPTLAPCSVAPPACSSPVLQSLSPSRPFSFPFLCCLQTPSHSLFFVKLWRMAPSSFLSPPFPGSLAKGHDSGSCRMCTALAEKELLRSLKLGAGVYFFWSPKVALPEVLISWL